MATRSDSFDRANSTSLGADWAEDTGTWEIVTNRVRQTSATGAYRKLRWVGAAMDSNNYYVEASALSDDGNVGVGVAGRMSTTAATITFYAIVGFGGDSWYLVRLLAGVETILATGPACAANTAYTVRLTCDGTTIRASVNGTQFASLTDANIASGSPGIITYGGQAASGAYLDTWTASDLAPAGVSVTPAAAAGGSAVVAPTVTRGSLNLSPAAASASSTIAPTVTRGALSLTPAAAASGSAVVAPTVAASAPTVTPAATTVLAAVVDPAVARGSLSVTIGSSAQSASTTVAPTVTRGALSLSPAAAVGASAVVAPTVARGALSLTPAAAGTAGGVAAPAVAYAPGASLRLFGTATGGIDRVRFPLTSGGGTVATAINVGAAAFTYELWIRCAYADNATSATDVRFSNIILDRDVWNDTRGHVPLGVTRDGANLVLIAGFNVGGTWTSGRGTANVGDGAWHHVAVSRSGTTARLFADGVLQATLTVSAGSYAYPTGYTPTGGQDNEYLVLGAEKHDFVPGDGGYRGLVDDLRVSNVARYTAGFTPPTAPHASDGDTVGLFRLDSSSGTVAVDATGSGDGELRVGGANSGPLWDGRTAVVPGASVAPAAAAAASAAVAPSVARGSLGLTPAAASTASAVIPPTPVAGALSLTPGAAAAASAVVAPTVAAGALSLSPSLATTTAAAAPPAVAAGALSLSPSAVAAGTGVVAPDVIGAGGGISPAAAASTTTALPPAVVAGLLSLGPGPAGGLAAALPPTVVRGALSLATAAALAAAAVIAPTPVAGPLSLAVAAAPAGGAVVAPAVGLGAATASPGAAAVAAGAVAPAVLSADSIQGFLRVVVGTPRQPAVAAGTPRQPAVAAEEP